MTWFQQLAIAECDL